MAASREANCSTDRLMGDIQQFVRECLCSLISQKVKDSISYFTIFRKPMPKNTILLAFRLNIEASFLGWYSKMLSIFRHAFPSSCRVYLSSRSAVCDYKRYPNPSLHYIHFHLPNNRHGVPYISNTQSCTSHKQSYRRRSYFKVREAKNSLWDRLSCSLILHFHPFPVQLHDELPQFHHGPFIE